MSLFPLFERRSRAKLDRRQPILPMDPREEQVLDQLRRARDLKSPTLTKGL
jgi:hypothetical protein